MSRAWTTALAVVFLIACGIAVSSCYTFRSTCSPALNCCGHCGGVGGGSHHPQRTKALFKVQKDAAPNPFFAAIDSTGLCADLPGKQGLWVGRMLMPLDQKRAYCGYLWHSDGFTRPEHELFAALTTLSSADGDPAAMGVQQVADPAAGPTDPEMDAWFADRYAVTRSRLGEPDAADDPQRTGSVRVAVIDTAAGDFYGTPDDQVGHGRSVGRLIEDVACKGHDPCSVEIKNYAALPLTTSNTGFVQIHGSGAGSYGTPGFLAEQIERAVHDWRVDRSAGAGPDHLVVNLSLGWSGCWNRPNADLTSGPVYLAILRASCQGAIVVAAGGNIEAVHGCPNSSPGVGTVGEHVFPAQYLNHMQRPDPKACSAAGVDVTNAAALGPLLLGVSAVDENDAQLVAANQESTLVAYGNAVVVPDHAGWTRQLSGTSMSAATVSGIAAAVWAAFPKRSVVELERDLIEPAVVLRERPKTPSSFLCNALPTPLPMPECGYVRRASLCRSLAHAAGMSSSCGPAASEPPPPTTRPDVPLALTGDKCTPELCPPPGPDAIDSTEQPWAIVGPQPAGNSCGTCQYTRSTTTFKGRFVAGTVSGAKPGWVSFSSGDYSLWDSSMTTMSVTRNIAAGRPSSGMLWYSQPSTAGSIYFYETVVIK